MLKICSLFIFFNILYSQKARPRCDHPTTLTLRHIYFFYLALRFNTMIKMCFVFFSQDTQCVFQRTSSRFTSNRQYEWSEWAAWGQCSNTCGTGSKVRRRDCMSKVSPIRKVPYSHCPGETSELVECQTGDCPGKNILIKID